MEKAPRFKAAQGFYKEDIGENQIGGTFRRVINLTVSDNPFRIIKKGEAETKF
jgi:hypothetical protein